MRLLVTRPEADAARTADLLRGRGHSVILAPLTIIEPIADPDLGPGNWSALLVTSANAVRAVAADPRAADLKSLPVFAVGRRSADAARAAGFSEVASADGNVDDLTELVARRFAGRNARFLYLAGEDRSGDLAGALAARGFTVRTVVVYRAVPATTLPVEARTALAKRQIDGVLHYSRRGADIFLDCAGADGLRAQALMLRHYCLSAQVGEPLAAAGAGTIAVAERPDETALIALVDAE